MFDDKPDADSVLSELAASDWPVHAGRGVPGGGGEEEKLHGGEVPSSQLPSVYAGAPGKKCFFFKSDFDKQDIVNSLYPQCIQTR